MVLKPFIEKRKKKRSHLFPDSFLVILPAWSPTSLFIISVHVWEIPWVLSKLSVSYKKKMILYTNTYNFFLVMIRMTSFSKSLYTISLPFFMRTLQYFIFLLKLIIIICPFVPGFFLFSFKTFIVLYNYIILLHIYYSWFWCREEIQLLHIARINDTLKILSKLWKVVCFVCLSVSVSVSVSLLLSVTVAYMVFSLGFRQLLNA